MSIIGIAELKLSVFVFLMGVVLLLLAGVGYCVYRKLIRVSHNGDSFAIPVRDVDAKRRAEQLEDRLINLEHEVLQMPTSRTRNRDGTGGDNDADADTDSRN
jgi:hypothetical protein